MGGLGIAEVRDTLADALHSHGWKSASKHTIRSALKTRSITVQLLELSGVPRFVEFAYYALCKPAARRAFTSQAPGWDKEVAAMMRAHVEKKVSSWQDALQINEGIETSDVASVQMHSCMTLYTVPCAAGQVLAHQCCALTWRH